MNGRKKGKTNSEKWMMEKRRRNDKMVVEDEEKN